MPEFSTATATALSIAQSLLVAEKDKGPITAALITERVAIAASVVAPGNEESVDRAAAVAELIEAASGMLPRDSTYDDDDEARLRAALARVSGGAA